MHCPEVIVFDTDWITITRYGAGDYGSQRAPLAVRLNIFRYECILRMRKCRLRLNSDGRAWLKVSNAMFRLATLYCRHEWYTAHTDRPFCLKCLRRQPTRLGNGHE